MSQSYGTMPHSPPMRLTTRNASREHHLEDIAYNHSQLSANGLVRGRRANARNVSFITRYGGKFTFST